MHFCADEGRALITAIQHPDLMLAHALAYLKRLWVGLKRVCRRCPEHCPRPAKGPQVVVSEGPPMRSLVDIIQNPPKLVLSTDRPTYTQEEAEGLTRAIHGED